MRQHKYFDTLQKININYMDKYWSILTLTIDFVKYSEAKAGILITIYGIILTLIYTNANQVYEAISTNEILLLISVLNVIIALVSLFFAIKCVSPQLKNNNPNSIIYFGHIQEKFDNYEDYFKFSKEVIDNDKFDEYIAEQIYINSKVAWKKFKDVTWSIRTFSLNIALLVISLLIYLF